MKIILTGATGFVGSYVLGKFLQNGYDCILLKRSTSSLKRIRHLPVNRSYNVDQSSIDRIFSEVGRVDGIVHMATCYDYEDDIQKLVAAELELPQEIFRVFSPGAKFFINTATYSMDFPDDYPYLIEYNDIKRRHVEILRKKSEDGGDIKIVNLKLFHVYGPRDSKRKMTSSIIDALCSGSEHLDLTSGEQERDFIYVKDVAEAFVTVVERCRDIPDTFSIFDVGTGQSYSVKSFVSLAKRISGASTELRFGALPLREHEVMSLKAHPLALERLGWRPFYQLDQGLTEYITHYREEQ